MTNIVWDPGFKKRYKKKIQPDPELSGRFKKAVELFAEDPFAARLRTHKLTGKLEGLWSFSISYDCRIICMFLRKDEVLFIDSGSHEEVY